MQGQAAPVAGSGEGAEVVSQLGRLRVACFRVVLAAEEPLTVPPYKGSALRGGFGSAFKKLCCVFPDRKYCAGCALHHACSYGLIFETAPPPDSTHTAKYRDVPRPFVIVPPSDGRTSYERGDRLEFSLNVFGRAVEHFAYFILAFEEFGRRGLGRGRGKVAVEKVIAFPPRPLLTATGDGQKGEPGVADLSATTVYGSNGVLRPWPGQEVKAPLRAALEAWGALSRSVPSGAGRPSGPARPGRGGGMPRQIEADSRGSTLRMRFLTPTRVTWQGDLVTRPVFHVLFRSALRRLSSLAYFHHGFELDVDFAGLARLAEEVELVEDRTYWVDWERYSSRQGERMRLGGFVGEATFMARENTWSRLLPFVFLAPLVHLGKNTTFGLGRVQLSIG